MNENKAGKIKKYLLIGGLVLIGGLLIVFVFISKSNSNASANTNAATDASAAGGSGGPGPIIINNQPAPAAGGGTAGNGSGFVNYSAYATKLLDIQKLKDRIAQLTGKPVSTPPVGGGTVPTPKPGPHPVQIGRASCRERV